MLEPTGIRAALDAAPDSIVIILAVRESVTGDMLMMIQELKRD